MPRLSKVSRLIILGIWLIAASLLYWLPGKYGFCYMPLIYIALIAVDAALYILINGGLRSIASDERLRTSKDKNIDKSKIIPENERPNPLKISHESRIFWSDILLIAGVVPMAIILCDYLLISFNII